MFFLYSPPDPVLGSLDQQLLSAVMQLILYLSMSCPSRENQSRSTPTLLEDHLATASVATPPPSTPPLVAAPTKPYQQSSLLEGSLMSILPRRNFLLLLEKQETPKPPSPVNQPPKQQAWVHNQLRLNSGQIGNMYVKIERLLLTQMPVPSHKRGVFFVVVVDVDLGQILVVD